MRYTSIRGKDDGLHFELGSNVDIICEVMNIGKAIDYLIYEAELTGAELLEFLGKFRIEKDITDKIKPENTYIITAYDW